MDHDLKVKVEAMRADLREQIKADCGRDTSIPHVLGHPATADWCAAVDAHHQATEDIIADAQGLRPETGKALLWTLDSLKAKVELMRVALEDISTTAHCIALAGPAKVPTLQDAWGEFMHIGMKANEAIYQARKL